MNSPGAALERLFLKIFKVVILSVMTLCLLGTLGALALAGYQATRKAKKPEPARPAPVETVNPADFVKDLKPSAPEKDPAKEAEPAPAPAEPAPVARPRKYLQETQKIAQCAHTFRQLGDPSAGPMPDAELESLRANIERVADAGAYDRGQAWVTDAVTFACTVLSNPEVVALKRAGRIDSIFVDAMNFHIKRWDRMKERVQAHDERERSRVRREAEAEAERVAASKAAAVVSLTAAGAAFGIFLVLALYLIVSAIETNLRGIHEALRQGHPAPGA